MLVNNTPVEDYRAEFGLLVKREDLSCPPPGPPFSKTRGVYAHIANRPEKVIGVLDTYHSQAGHAVAQACSLLGKRAVNFYPVRKAERDAPIKPQQQAAQDLGAELFALQAGRSAILYHEAKKRLQSVPAWSGGYMMPNALKLPEMITQTAVEAYQTWKRCQMVGEDLNTIAIAISSGTIAAGVIKGICDRIDAVNVSFKAREVNETYSLGYPTFVLHMGYQRSHVAVLEYMQKMAGRSFTGIPMRIVDEGYSYGDVAKPGIDPPWPCNKFYDLKAFRWWLREGRATYGEALLWNIG